MAHKVPAGYRAYFAWFELIVVYGLIECALWSHPRLIRDRWAIAAAIAMLVFVSLDVVLTDQPLAKRLGLALPTTLGASIVLGVSLAIAFVMIFAVRWAGGEVPANGIWPSVSQSWAYLVWALLQEFILQSFFFTRCEDLFGGDVAVWAAATLFAVAHLPSPLLTTFTFVVALFFCSVFRRYRSIYPIALVHDLLGLTVAMTMPDSLLHHMRVGIGYLRY
ncbi:MAG TPA: CPBP family intramembrane glutamic endopeptidase [Terriglobales bacterium]|nr:CPBP family intramembrane glutamic endopeptidase [Terriglobales bacterium]